jgi:hypothetical protein
MINVCNTDLIMNVHYIYYEWLLYLMMIYDLMINVQYIDLIMNVHYDYYECHLC